MRSLSYLGLTVVNNNRFEELFKEEKERQNNNKLCRYSTNFLHKCSNDEAFIRLNESPELVNFIKLYFSIGNVIPIWPGGNEVRGKMGIYDIPELFFNKYRTWTLELIRQYQNAYIDSVLNNDMFLVCHKSKDKGYTIKGYQKSFNNIKVFKECIKDKTNTDNYTGFYFDYLKRRIKIIKRREIKLKEWLNNKKNE